MNSRQDGLYNALIVRSLRRMRAEGRRVGPISYRKADELYSYNGIVSKIISAPAEDAIRAGFSIMEDGVESKENDAILSVLEDLEAEKQFSTALSWDRLYGGAAVLVLANDGGSLEDPLDERRIKNVERLEVYTPEDISFTEDYFYNDPFDPNYGKPRFYTLTGYHGNSFLVHESRLLLFRGATISSYHRRMRNGWGGTVLEQVQKDFMNYKEGLRLALSALSRMSQGILKLDGLKDILMGTEGERRLQERMQLIDLYRHLENTIALGTTDEYELKSLSLSGIKEIVEVFQSALSASTSIPSTVLFGRSPAGMNATGVSDLENYYNMVSRIQRRSLRPNLMRLVYLVSLASDYGISLPDKWHIEFKPLWNPSEAEVAEMAKVKMDTLAQKANTAMMLMQMGALDGTEVRATLKNEGAYEIDDSLDKALLVPVAAPTEGE